MVQRPDPRIRLASSGELWVGCAARPPTKPRHPVPRSPHPNQRTSGRAHPATRVTPVNLANHASRAKAAVTAANPVKAAHVEMAAQPTTVGEPSPPVVLNQPDAIPKPPAKLPKAVATAKVEAAVPADRNAPQERLVHRGKSVRPAEVPIRKAMQWTPLQWILRPSFKVESCRPCPRALV